jgi:glycosyltransferase involved in cell wall biosynthesis
MPLVTVYVPVYNGAKYLPDALASIRAQNFTDWECLLIDDASTDGSAAILEAYGSDPRFRIYRQPANLNVANASNLALRLAQGKYLARLDQDDIAVPQRLALQVSLLESRPDVWVCGGAIEYFGAAQAVARPPAEDGRIKANLLGGMDVIANPASTLRIERLREHGVMNDPRFPLSCDYGLWVDCTLAGATLANLPDVVTRYRVHEEQGSRQWDTLQQGVTNARLRLLHAWFPHFTYAEIAVLEPLLRANASVVLTAEAARQGVELCGRAIAACGVSTLGEDRAAVSTFLQQRLDEWDGHLALLKD